MATKKKAATKKAVAKRPAAKKAATKKTAAVKKTAPAKKKASPRKAPARKAAPRARATTRGAGSGLSPGYELVQQLVTIDGVLNVDLGDRIVPLQQALAEGNVLAWSLSQLAGGGTPAEAIAQLQKLLQFLEEAQALQATISITCCPG